MVNYGIGYHTIIYYGKFTAPKHHGIFYYGIPWYFLTRVCFASSRKGRWPLSLPCWLKLFLRPKTSLRPRMSLSLQTFPKILRSLFIPRRTSTADPRPYVDSMYRLVDPAAVTLPLHSTPMDEDWGIWCTRITWNAVCTASIWKVTTSSGTNTSSTIGRIGKFTQVWRRLCHSMAL